MTQSELLDLVAAYEREHDVQRYVYDGLPFWPLARVTLAFAAFNELVGMQDRGLRQATDQPAPRVSRWRTGWRLLRNTWREWKLARSLDTRDSRPAILLLTQGNRYQQDGEFAYQTIVDPWIEMLQRRGVRSVVLEAGEPPAKQQHPKQPIQERAEWRMLAARLIAAVQRKFGAREPAWYRECYRWQRDTVGHVVGWPQQHVKYLFVRQLARMIGKSIDRHRCRAVIVDTWYSPYAMGAALAADRRGLPVIDLQHGSQHGSHMAYAGWSKPHGGRKAMMPDLFWVWGKANKRNLLEMNPGAFSPDHVITGGNLWMTRWQTEESGFFENEAAEMRSIAAAGPVTVVITLQDKVKYVPILRTIIQQNPRDWVWMIRPHRAMQETTAQVAAHFADLTSHNIHVTAAARLPLYTLLKQADIHVTWFSTCAQEALAFHTPTILLDEVGSRAYGYEIDQGVMFLLTSTDQFSDLVQRCMRVEWESKGAVVDNAFVRPQQAEEQVQRLLERILPDGDVE